MYWTVVSSSGIGVAQVTCSRSALRRPTRKLRHRATRLSWIELNWSALGKHCSRQFHCTTAPQKGGGGGAGCCRGGWGGVLRCAPRERGRKTAAARPPRLPPL